jgi:hypothetical protein
MPEFPEFKPLDLNDLPVVIDLLKEYKPGTSEWTFTNLFIWRSHYGFRWSRYRDWLMVIVEEPGGGIYAMQPIGPSPRSDAVLALLSWLREERGQAVPRIEKADSRLASELKGLKYCSVEPARDQFDYIYLRSDLVALEGSKYRSKRNHINKLSRLYNFTYEPLRPEHIGACIELQEKWCQLRRCSEDLNLLGEWEAIREILRNFSNLTVQGGVIIVGRQVCAFTVGELLNEETAVVHIEKADEDIPGLYPIINQQFCEQAWTGIKFINREQDLGLPGLREAKLSYYPHHFAEKFTVRLTG